MVTTPAGNHPRGGGEGRGGARAGAGVADLPPQCVRYEERAPQAMVSDAGTADWLIMTPKEGRQVGGLDVT